MLEHAHRFLTQARCSLCHPQVGTGQLDVANQIESPLDHPFGHFPGLRFRCGDALSPQPEDLRRKPGGELKLFRAQREQHEHRRVCELARGDDVGSGDPQFREQLLENSVVPERDCNGLAVVERAVQGNAGRQLPGAGGSGGAERMPRTVLQLTGDGRTKRSGGRTTGKSEDHQHQEQGPKINSSVTNFHQSKPCRIHRRKQVFDHIHAVQCGRGRGRRAPSLREI